jgi:deoxynucleoside triphosphate triphosphohydrolase SAMHD1
MDKIRKLRAVWFGADSPFTAQLNQTLDLIGFTAQYVERIASDAQAGKFPQRAKVIKDNTWGMIEVDWSSVRLLDSPIMQRLRSVKQLGFTYLTYPSAEHSRFIHSLGMYAVVSRFLDAMDRQPIDGCDEQDGIKLYRVQPQLRTDLLHAAILHDSGHLPFSHATEAALVGDQKKFNCASISVEDFVFSTVEILGKKIQLSEALSLAFILCPRFESFYQRFVRPSEDPDAVLRIAALVAGLKPLPNLRGAADLISNSSVDSDKVDYVNRDALACGIPVGLDVARLFLRSSFYEVTAEKLAKLNVPNPSGSEVVFVVNSSGVDTIDELAHARAALYQRVYLHQTTRNAERLLSKCLEALPASTTDGSPEPLRNTLSLLALDDAGLIRLLCGYNEETVARLAERLHTRQLPKRACVFGRSFAQSYMAIGDALPGLSQADLAKHTLGMVVAHLRSDELVPEKLRDLERKIADEATKLVRLLRSRGVGALPETEVPSLVTMLPMTELKGLSKEAIVLENRELVHSSQRSISDEQSEAADIYKALGYVLTDYDWREATCLAARKVFAMNICEKPRPMDIQISQHGETSSIKIQVAGRLVLDLSSVVRRTGLLASRVAMLEDAAAGSGYFDDTPWLMPFDKASAIPIAERLRKFDGEGGWTVNAKTCAAFIRQFPSRLRDEMVGVLNHLTLIDRSLIKQSLLRIIDQHVGTHKTFVTGLTPDSGNEVRMILEQESKSELASKNAEIEKSVHVALEKMGDADCLVLCDDNISSGSQSECQLRQWGAIPIEQWPEAHRTEVNIDQARLRPEHLDKLRRVKVLIGVCVGNPDSTVQVSETARSLGLTAFKGVFVGTSGVGRAPSMSNELESFLAKIGCDLRAYFKFNKSADDLPSAHRADCERDALGYGGARNVLATYLNVPTSTITCLWLPGMANGHPWMPLLMRRGYLRKLIAA